MSCGVSGRGMIAWAVGLPGGGKRADGIIPFLFWKVYTYHKGLSRGELGLSQIEVEHDVAMSNVKWALYAAAERT